MSGNPIPDVDPDEAERRQYTALTDAFAGVLDLRAGLADATDIADYVAGGSHLGQLFDLATGLRSALKTGGSATSNLKDATSDLKDTKDA